MFAVSNNYLPPPIYHYNGNINNSLLLNSNGISNNTNTCTSNNNNNSNVNNNNDNNNNNIGGVSSVLDYDMDQMTKFVCWLSFGLFKRNDNPSLKFNNQINHVLVSTRLPKSTIILSLLYLSNKLELETNDSISNDEEIFQNLIISFILSNKFNDDNTFRNKSWSDATNLPIDLINRLELNWLNLIKFNLHNLLDKNDSYNCIEECWKTWCNKFIVENNNPTPLSPPLTIYENKDFNNNTNNYFQQYNYIQQNYLKSPNSIFSYNNERSDSSYFLNNSSPPSQPSPKFNNSSSNLNNNFNNSFYENPYHLQLSNNNLNNNNNNNSNDYFYSQQQINYGFLQQQQQQQQQMNEQMLNYQQYSVPPPPPPPYANHLQIQHQLIQKDPAFYKNNFYY